MVEIIYTYDIPKELQEEYLKATREKIKPAWESRGCRSYDVLQATDGDEMAFMKRMVFPDEETMKKTLGLLQTDAELKAAVDLWRQYVYDFRGRIITKATRRTFISKT